MRVAAFQNGLSKHILSAKTDIFLVCRIKNNYNKGFLQILQTEDVFVHYSAIQSDGYRSLEDGQKGEFEIVQGRKGLEASNLTLSE